MLASIGNTPLFRLDRIAEGLKGIEIYAKAEYFNPGGSVKDRPALNMINTGEQDGRLTPDKIILDATSGNTGIAYAMIAAARGYRAMQFNFVVSTNERAVRLWQRFQFEIVGRLPGAFLHPTLGYVDAYIMFRTLEDPALKT